MLTIDRTRCTGCGTCLDACLTGAIGVNGDDRVAMIDLALCDECLACLDICPNDAIRLSESSELMPAVSIEVVEGEIVEAETMPAPLAIPEPAPLVALAGTALSFVGSWLLPRAADALVAAVDRRLVQRGGLASSATSHRSRSQPSMRYTRRGRRVRFRQRRSGRGHP